MRLPGLLTRRGVVRAVGWTVAATTAAQLAAAVAVTTVDEVRKRRATPPAGFPSASPRTVDVAGNHITTYTSGEDVFEDRVISTHRHLYNESHQ